MPARFPAAANRYQGVDGKQRRLAHGLHERAVPRMRQQEVRAHEGGDSYQNGRDGDHVFRLSQDRAGRLCLAVYAVYAACDPRRIFLAAAGRENGR